MKEDKNLYEIQDELVLPEDIDHHRDEDVPVSDKDYAELKAMKQTSIDKILPALRTIQAEFTCPIQNVLTGERTTISTGQEAKAYKASSLKSLEPIQNIESKRVESIAKKIFAAIRKKLRRIQKHRLADFINHMTAWEEAFHVKNIDISKIPIGWGNREEPMSDKGRKDAQTSRDRFLYNVVRKVEEKMQKYLENNLKIRLSHESGEIPDVCEKFWENCSFKISIAGDYDFNPRKISICGSFYLNNNLDNAKWDIVEAEWKN